MLTGVLTGTDWCADCCCADCYTGVLIGVLTEGAAIRGAATRAPQAAAAEASNDPLRAMIENEIAHTTGTQVIWVI